MIRPHIPEQDPPISVPTATATPSPTPEPTPTPTSTATPTPAPPLYPQQPKLGAKLGSISLPSLGLTWPLYEGTSDTQLAKGVGHYVASVLPGLSDNSVLSGHRTTVFNRLGELHKRDLILVKTRAGTFAYRVRSFKVVDRGDRAVIVPTSTAVLTLTTCYPFDHVGITTKAFIVTADLVQSELTNR